MFSSQLGALKIVSNSDTYLAHGFDPSFLWKGGGSYSIEYNKNGAVSSAPDGRPFRKSDTVNIRTFFSFASIFFNVNVYSSPLLKLYVVATLYRPVWQLTIHFIINEV